MPMLVPANYNNISTSTLDINGLKSWTYVAQDDGQKSHAANRANCAGRFDPVIPAISEHSRPSVRDKCLHKHEHAKGERDEFPGEVVQDCRHSRKGLTEPPGGVFKEELEGDFLVIFF